MLYAAKSADCCSTHLIDGDGTMDVVGLEKFMKEVKLSECGLSYAIVSIMGPQSSGTYSYARVIDRNICIAQWIMTE